MANVASESQRNFVANRAVGRIALSATLRDGLTRRKRLHEAGSLRLRFPNSDPRSPEAVIVNTAGGIAGGDRLDLAFEIENGANLTVSSAAAEKVYRALDAEASIELRLSLGAGAAFAWLPQETILFDRARLTRRIEIDIAEDASLLMAEAVVFGRSAMGETVEDGSLFDRWRLRRGGQLVFAEGVRLDGPIAQTLRKPAVAHNGAAIATILVAPANDILLASIRALSDTFAGEVGISGWNGIALARLCARNGAALHHDLVAILAALRPAGLPRLWLN